MTRSLSRTAAAGPRVADQDHQSSFDRISRRRAPSPIPSLRRSYSYHNVRLWRVSLTSAAFGVVTDRTVTALGFPLIEACIALDGIWVAKASEVDHGASTIVDVESS